MVPRLYMNGLLFAARAASACDRSTALAGQVTTCTFFLYTSNEGKITARSHSHSCCFILSDVMVLIGRRAQNDFDAQAAALPDAAVLPHTKLCNAPRGVRLGMASKSSSNSCVGLQFGWVCSGILGKSMLTAALDHLLWGQQQQSVCSFHQL